LEPERGRKGEKNVLVLLNERDRERERRDEERGVGFKLHWSNNFVVKKWPIPQEQIVTKCLQPQ
jgi:hypothetical protein